MTFGFPKKKEEPKANEIDEMKTSMNNLLKRQSDFEEGVGKKLNTLKPDQEELTKTLEPYANAIRVLEQRIIALESKPQTKTPVPKTKKASPTQQALTKIAEIISQLQEEEVEEE